MNVAELKRVFKNFIITLSRQLISSLLQLTVVVLIARNYGPEGNGLLSLTLLLPSMLLSFFNFGIAPSNVYFLSSKRYQLKEVLKGNLKIFLPILTLGLISGSVVVLFFKDIFFKSISIELLWISLLILPLSLSLLMINSIFQALQKFKLLNFSLVLLPSLNLIIVTTGILSGKTGVRFLLFSVLSSSFVTLVISLLLLVRLSREESELNQSVSDRIDYVKDCLNYGIKSHLSNILSFINYRADMFIVNFFMSHSAVGLYAIAVQIVEKVWMISQALSTVLLPYLSEKNGEEESKIVTPLASRLIFLLSLVISFIIIVCGKLALVLVFGKQFEASFLPLVYLLPGIIAGASSRVLANDISARGKPELNMYTSIVVVVCNILLNIVLIPCWGLVGASVATSIAYIVNLILRMFIYKKLSNVRKRELLLVQKEEIFLLKKWF